MTKKVIAFSLWGDNPKYTMGAIRNAELAPEIYPGWEVWMYVGLDVPAHIQRALAKTTRLLKMGHGDWRGMFWRFRPADCSDTIMISRDTDSRLNLREKAAVDEWLASDKDFHIMRDHPYHQTEILGGMWGARNNILANNINQLVVEYEKDDRYQVDQDFLREKIYPLVRERAFVHDPFFDRKPFPTVRNGGEYVGKAYNGDDSECDSRLNNLVFGIN